VIICFLGYKEEQRWGFGHSRQAKANRTTSTSRIPDLIFLKLHQVIQSELGLTFQEDVAAIFLGSRDGINFSGIPY
jgi:hypothetical protein